MIVHDHNGGLILSACRQLSNCRDALGAELNAVLEGLKLALHLCDLRLICSEVLNLLNKEGVDRSVYASLIEEIKVLLKFCQHCITQVKRCQNSCSVFLAKFARTNSLTTLWLASGRV
jgi:hypothetical protein